MAASATPPSADPACVAVAASGGRDSTALLHATARAAQGLGLQVVALHVHHGLLPQADGWVEHLQRQCRDWAAQGLPVRLRWCRLEGTPGPGDSVEAWARRGRYAALTRMAQEEGADLVLLAHHRRDQAETFLLQALRGAGVAGLAAMPRQIRRDGLLWVRPWLRHAAEAVEAYVQAHGVGFVQDPSNADIRYARNRLRHEVMPALRAAFPQAEQVLGAAAQQAQQARECLRALAEIDLAQAGEGARLRGAALCVLPVARQLNLLRHWLQQRCGRGPQEALLQRLVREIPGEAPACWPLEGGWQLRRYRGHLSCEPMENIEKGAACSAQAPAPQAELSLDGPGLYRLPGWGGALRVEVVAEQGLALPQLQHCALRSRCGGEQFQLTPRGIPRSLKKQYQAAGVAPWRRSGPLLWLGEHLLFVPGLGIDARMWAPPGVPQLGLEWLPDAPG